MATKFMQTVKKWSEVVANFPARKQERIPGNLIRTLTGI